MKNRIYYFTGTGNCLKIAQDIASQIGDCELIGIHHNVNLRLDNQYDRIGFVFPVYYQGLPLAVCKALEQMNCLSNPNAYYFAVATYGALVGNALPQFAWLLKKRGVHLNYNAKVLMCSNWILMHNMSENIKEITERSNKEALSVIKAIKDKQQNRTFPFIAVLYLYHKILIGRANQADKGFHVNSNCISCSLCVKVCPVNNIIMEEGQPIYQHRCEQCMACIQRCPKQAINYKNRTQNRRRYYHPAISNTVLIEAQQGATTYK